MEEKSRRLPTISREKFHLLTRISLFFIAGIVVTGAAVRLTGSGLGCTDWPRCNENKFVDVSTHHGRIEQVNRLFTGVVGFAVILAMLGAQRLREPSRAMRRLGATLVLGVLGQVVLGGIVVLTGLNPLANMGHFALSMFLVGTNVAMLVGSGSYEIPAPSSKMRKSFDVFMILATLVLVAGMVVTGAGPHAGDEDVVRFGIAVTTATRIHSVLVWLMLAWFVRLLINTRRSGEMTEWIESRFNQLLAVVLAQGAVGYWQYFTDVPAGLVGIHIALATLFWILTTRIWFELRSSIVRGTSEAIANS